MLASRTDSCVCLRQSSRRAGCRVARYVAGNRLVARALSSPEAGRRAEQKEHGPLHRVAGSALGSLVGVALLLTPQPAIASPSLSEVMREDFGFIDTNKDGLITKDEVRTIAEEEAKNLDVVGVPDDQVSFAMRLFDLNGDGKLETNEFLVGLALDRGVSDDAVDGDIYRAFDSNNDGAVDEREWTSALSELGPNSRPVAEYVYQRVAHVTDAKGGKLDLDAFVPAFTQMRSVVLGY